MSTFAGSLIGKRKADLVDIASALGLPTAEAKLVELREAIQAKLEAEEATLKESPVFKGLYGRRRATHALDSDSGSPSAATDDVKAAVADTAARGRKSLNRALQSVQQAADIPLPDSPAAAVRVVSERASSAVALVPRNVDSHALVVRAQDVKNQIVKYAVEHNRRVERYVRKAQTAIVQASLAVELGLLFRHVVQFYNHTIFFPPSAGDGALAALVHALFFWVPEMTTTVRLPEISSLAPDAHFWPAVITWFFVTVLPPFALSNIVSFVPQKHRAHATHPTSKVAPTFDPLTFAFFRVAALALPLTSAAPAALVDALKPTGDAQGRLLVGALAAALVLAERLAK